jgi:hypothetical protein
MRRFFFHISIFIQQRIKKKVHVIAAESDEHSKKKSAGI